MSLCLNTPAPLETERLIIRCPRPGDGNLHHEAVVESLATLRRFPASLSWVMDEPSAEASERFCCEAAASYQQGTSMPMLLFLKESGSLVGSSGLHSFDQSGLKCEIGFWIRASRTQQGLATEAVRAIAAFAFEVLGMRRVEALPDDENLASCRVCECAGFRLELVLQGERTDPAGCPRNTRLYAITR